MTNKLSRIISSTVLAGALCCEFTGVWNIGKSFYHLIMQEHYNMNRKINQPSLRDERADNEAFEGLYYFIAATPLAIVYEKRKNKIQSGEKAK